jgi:hypothetical protein
VQESTVKYTERRQIALLIAIVIAAFVITSTCTIEKRPGIEELESQIQAILELPTYEHIYRDIIYVDRERSFLIFKIMQARVLFSIDVRVQAGIDLAEGFKVIPDPAFRRDGGITVVLPTAKILLVDADESSIQQYFIKEVGGELARLDYYDEINRKKEDIISDAIERGILLNATQNAKKLIAGFLTQAGFKNVTFDSRKINL